MQDRNEMQRWKQKVQKEKNVSASIRCSHVQVRQALDLAEKNCWDDQAFLVIHSPHFVNLLTCFPTEMMKKVWIRVK